MSDMLSNMHEHFRLFIYFGLCLMLAACGTTSKLQPAQADLAIDLTPYDKLLVEDFGDEVTSKAKPEAALEVGRTMRRAVRQFPDQIADVVAANRGFESVVREGVADDSTLILRGAITDYDAGNVALRRLIGLGAGSADFDARLELVDGGTGELLGTWTVNKFSWVLGGELAASQTPEGFMFEAAKRIGEELASKRKEGRLLRPGSE